jgi:hypothetical protein
VLQRQSPTIYIQRRHGPLRGPLTILLVIWAIAYPALLLLLAPLGPLGLVIGLGAAILLFVPWVSGIVILGFMRWLT